MPWSVDVAQQPRQLHESAHGVGDVGQCLVDVGEQFADVGQVADPDALDAGAFQVQARHRLVHGADVALDHGQAVRDGRVAGLHEREADGVGVGGAGLVQLQAGLHVLQGRDAAGGLDGDDAVLAQHHGDLVDLRRVGAGVHQP